MNLREVVSRVNEWAHWRVKLETSALGYPSSTVESRLNQGGRRPPAAIVPDIVMNPRAAEIDRAINNLPDEFRSLIYLRHVQSGTEAQKVKIWCTAHDCGRTKYYRAQDQAYGFIAGWIKRET